MEPEPDAPAAPPWAPGFAHVTAEVEPVDAVLRESPEHFLVEELPAHEPTGSGTHVWFELEKRGLSTRAALRRLGRALGRPERDFGYGGLKDARAVTRQWVSIEHLDPDLLRAVDLTPGIRVGRVERSARKLRVGALAGNRFTIRLSGLDRTGQERIDRVLSLLTRSGLPNYYGPQRFGAGGRGYEGGAALLRRDFRAFVLAFAAPGLRASASQRALADLLGPERAPEPEALRQLAYRLDSERAGLARHVARSLAEGRAIDWADAARAVPRRSRQMSVSSLQSRVFNRVLAERIRRAGAAALGHLDSGDVAWLHRGGASFLVTPEDLDPSGRGPETTARLEALELSPSGPIPGYRMLAAEGPTGERERAALAAEGLDTADFRGLGMGLDQRGARRPLRVPLGAPEARHEEGATTLVFELPKGAFATALLEELRKELAGSGVAPG